MKGTDITNLRMKNLKPKNCNSKISSPILKQAHAPMNKDVLNLLTPFFKRIAAKGKAM